MTAPDTLPTAADPGAAPVRLRVLVVDDHPRIREPLAAFLRREGMEVDTAADARTLLSLLELRRFDAVVLDVMLPDGDGSQLCARVQAEHGVPVLLLTARAAVDDRVRGLEHGADDYVIKPFDPRELLARIRAVLRRRGATATAAAALAPQLRPGRAPDSRCFAFAGWHFDAARGSLRPPAGPARLLSDAEARLLEVLLHHAGAVLSREQLLDLTRTQGRQGEAAFDRTIDRQISRLRTRLQGGTAEDTLLRTVRGGGYSLVVRAERAEPLGG
ncbi:MULTISPECIES: response regulator transcription factor [unclassified Acidovorax]|uniref:response regulator transcription factor n=1 Tax=unclassified Acidovorax TaxID=2684926 RepID=UPI0028830EC6|nr:MULTISPECIES: response regulator transcription factor [unclassified Acidovorax]